MKYTQARPRRRSTHRNAFRVSWTLAHTHLGLTSLSDNGREVKSGLIPESVSLCLSSMHLWMGLCLTLTLLNGVIPGFNGIPTGYHLIRYGGWGWWCETWLCPLSLLFQPKGCTCNINNRAVMGRFWLAVSTVAKSVGFRVKWMGVNPNPPTHPVT